MATTYSITITKLYSHPTMDGNDDVICRVEFDYSADDTVNVETMQGVETLNVVDIESFNASPSHADIVGWLDDIGVSDVDGPYKPHLDAALLKTQADKDLEAEKAVMEDYPVPA